MKWKKKSTRYFAYRNDDIIAAMDIIEEAYEKRIINWNIFKKAMAGIRTMLNGSWMFEQIKEIDDG